MKFNLIDGLMFIIMGIAAVRHFGMLEGLGIVAAVYLLAPYYAVGHVDVGKGSIR